MLRSKTPERARSQSKFRESVNEFLFGREHRFLRVFCAPRRDRANKIDITSRSTQNQTSCVIACAAHFFNVKSQNAVRFGRDVIDSDFWTSISRKCCGYLRIFGWVCLCVCQDILRNRNWLNELLIGPRSVEYINCLCATTDRCNVLNSVFLCCSGTVAVTPAWHSQHHYPEIETERVFDRS